MADTGSIDAFEQVTARIDALIEAPDDALAEAAPTIAVELLGFGEAILEHWLQSNHMTPTKRESEGFRLLALHRQGARGEPSFNACRETCRELVYNCNLIRLDPQNPEVARRIRLGSMVARHLALFVGGKLEIAGLGEFCCSSRPLREREAIAPSGA